MAQRTDFTGKATAAGIGLAVVCCLTTSLAAIGGTVLATVGTSAGRYAAIALYNTTTHTWTQLVSTSDFIWDGEWGPSNVYNLLHGACFSPDGKQVAYFRYQLNTGSFDGSNLVVMDNDGSNVTQVCQSFNGPPLHDLYASWAANGYIYWSEYDQNVYRVNVTTRQREIVASLADFGGDPTPPDIKTLKVSLDGTRAGYTSAGDATYGYTSSGLNLSTRTAYAYGSGCQGTVSPNGQLVTRNRGPDIGYDYHQIAYVQDFQTKAIVDTIITPGAVPGQSGSGQPRSSIHRFSHSSNSHVVMVGEDGAYGHGFLANITTNEYLDLGRGPDVGTNTGCCPFDYWDGALPPPPSAGPVIALNKSALTFSSVGGATPTNQTVNVTNSGTGTLTSVNVITTPSSVPWLTLTVTGGGNAQTITNAVSATGLAPGAHSATVTVTGGGASNSVNYAVTFNVGSSVNAPTALSATSSDNESVNLSWTDNATNEMGFVVERREASGTFQVLTTVAANATTYTDAGPLADGSYAYRVRAVAGADSSGWSNEAPITLATPASVTLTGPAAGMTWEAGSTQHITWTTYDVNVVDVEYSLDDAETWLLVNTGGSVDKVDAEWGDYPFVVPDVCTDNLLLRVRRYGASNPVAYSQPVTVTGCTGLSFSACNARQGSGTWLTGAASAQGTLDIRYSTEDARGAVLRLFRFDGRCVAQLRLASGRGEHHAAVDLASHGTGAYVAEIRYDTIARQGKRVAAVVTW